MSEAAGVIELVGRLLFGLQFILAGAGFHITKSKMAEEYARSMRFPIPGIAGWPTGVWMVAGGASIALGIWPDIGALMIAVFAIPAAAWFHRFWQVFLRFALLGLTAHVLLWRLSVKSNAFRWLLWLWMSLVIVAAFYYAPGTAEGFQAPESYRILFFHVPMAWASFAGFIVAFLGIAFYSKMRRLAMHDAKHEFSEYLFLLPLFFSITLLQKTGFFELMYVHQGPHESGVLGDYCYTSVDIKDRGCASPRSSSGSSGSSNVDSQ